MKKRRNDKGFTLVELIVVLVILAILAAILVPALLGYIDKAREKQVTTNAEAAYVAAQAYYTECYGKNKPVPTDMSVVKQEIMNLTDITENFSVVIEGGGTTGSNKNQGSRSSYIIKKFEYTAANGHVASWDPVSGDWTVTEP